MRDILDQDRAMSLSAVKRAIGIVGILLALTAALVIFTALGRIFSGHLLAGVGRILGTLAITGFMYVILRLAGEILVALHRLNDPPVSRRRRFASSACRGSARGRQLSR